MSTLSFPQSRIATLLVVLLLVLAAAPGIAAAEGRTGGTVVVEEGETVGDLEVVGGTVVVRGTVDGDLAVLGGSVVVDGEVTGDLQSAAGSTTINGRIGDDVEVAAGTLSIGENAVIAGDLSAGAGTVTIDGRILGDAEVGADRIVLGSTAVIEGNLRYDGNLERAAGATVGGTVSQEDLSFGIGPVDGVTDAVLSVYGFLVNLTVGVVLLALFPGVSRRIAETGRTQAGKSGLAGFGVLVGVPVAIALTMLTIVGIPLALAGLLVFLLMVWMAYVYARFVVGTWLLSLADVDNRWAALLVGMLAMAVVVRIPWVGGILDFVALLVGLGALALVVLASVRSRRRSTDVTAAGEGDGDDGRDYDATLA